MRRACDSLKQANLRKNMEELKSSLFIPPSNEIHEMDVPNRRWTQFPNQQASNAVVMKPILKNPLGVSIGHNY